MVKNKKKTPGRPKKQFVSKKPKTTIKSGPGRPRKNTQHATVSKNKISPEIAGFVAKSVDESKRKDLVILLLFLLSFILFVVSLYFTFMRDKKAEDLAASELAEITNIETGNIDYSTQQETVAVPVETAPTVTVDTSTTQPAIQDLTSEQQVIVDFYQAVNSIDMTKIYTLTDAHLEKSNVFKTYYSRRWLTNFGEAISMPKIVVTNIQEVVSTSTNPDIKNFQYTVEYTLTNNQQKFTEERSTTLIKKGDQRKIGKLMCETKGCSTMPFFNTDKYK